MLGVISVTRAMMQKTMESSIKNVASEKICQWSATWNKTVKGEMSMLKKTKNLKILH